MPISNREIHEKVLLPTVVADGCSCFPPPNLRNALITLVGLPLNLLHECTESEIAHFSSPEPFHAVEVQILEVADIEPADNIEREFPMMVSALAFHFAMYTGEGTARPFSVLTALLFSRHRTIGTGDVGLGLCIELWRFILCAIGTGEERLETKVEPCCFTSSRVGCHSTSVTMVI